MTVLKIGAAALGGFALVLGGAIAAFVGLLKLEDRVQARTLTKTRGVTLVVDSDATALVESLRRNPAHFEKRPGR